MVRYNLDRKTLEKYAKFYCEGIAVKTSSGRSSILDADDLKELQAFVSTTRISKSLAELRVKVNEQAMERASKRGLYDPQAKPVSERTL